MLDVTLCALEKCKASAPTHKPPHHPPPTTQVALPDARIPYTTTNAAQNTIKTRAPHPSPTIRPVPKKQERSAEQIPENSLDGDDDDDDAELAEFESEHDRTPEKKYAPSPGRITKHHQRPAEESC